MCPNHKFSVLLFFRMYSDLTDLSYYYFIILTLKFCQFCDWYFFKAATSGFTKDISTISELINFVSSSSDCGKQMMFFMRLH